MGVKYLSDALKSNNTVTTLDLGNHKIGSDGAKYLSVALENNTTITRLNLYGNNIGPEGIMYLSDVLMRNTTITYLSLYNNKIGDVGAAYLLEAMKLNYSICNKNGIAYFIGAGQCSRQLCNHLENEIKTNQVVSRSSDWPCCHSNLNSLIQQQILEICACSGCCRDCFVPTEILQLIIKKIIVLVYKSNT